MPRVSMLEVLKTGRVLVSDGAWGSFLQKKGMKSGECPERWCLERPEDVMDIASSYVHAGADMIESDSFGASSLKLAAYGLADQAAQINRAAAKISRKAAGDKVWVIASIGPSGKLLVNEDVTEKELSESFQEQAEALAEGGADSLCIETMSDRAEAEAAVLSARRHTSCEVICTFTFEQTAKGQPRTMMGLTPTQAAFAAYDAGAHIIGTNCGNGIKGMLSIVQEMRAALPRIPILVHANAGLPQRINGQLLYLESPESMAAEVPALVAAGANIIGGCCGTTPEHIRAIRETLDKKR